MRDEFAWAQREMVAEVEKQYNNGKPVRVIVLKARQLGMSTITAGIIYWWGFYHPNTNGLVMAHDSETSGSLFEMDKLFWDTWAFNKIYSLKYATRRQMQWIETRSNLRVATAKNVQSGRGSTHQAIHASECAFYADPETLFTGLHQTIPYRHGTIEVLESTANGIGNWFYHQWQAASDGDSPFIPLFFPWYKHYEYALPTTLTIKSELDADEKNLLRLGGNYENIEWRRHKLQELNYDIRQFQQEYPAEPEEAFQSTGHPVFPRIKVTECYARVPYVKGVIVRDGNGDSQFVRDDMGPLSIFKMPAAQFREDLYMVSGDPTGSFEGDPACIQVLNRLTYEQVAVWHGHIDPMNFAYEMAKIGRFYHNAELCPEVEGGGAATIATLLQMNYPNLWMHRMADRPRMGSAYGWSTNYQRKRWAMGILLHLFVTNSIVIHDPKTYEQVLNYVVHDNGEWSNADRAMHDDAIMALSIAVAAVNTEGPIQVYGNQPAPTFDIFSQEAR